MSSDWPLVRLDKVLEITSSKRIKRAEYVRSGIPFFRSKEVIERSKGNEISTELFISEKRYEEIRKKFGAPESGDILLTSVGTLGVSYQVRESDKFYFKDGNLTWFRKFQDNILSEYVLYWIRSPHAQQKLDEVSIGSTQRALTIAALKSLEIPLPPKTIQAEIVRNIRALEQKIETNRGINQTLEQMAQAIFKSWFVDFEPVKAKIAALEAGGSEDNALLAAMQVISGKDPQQLTKLQTENPEHYTTLRATAELFPAAMQESELGEIPSGWEVLPLSKMVELIGGGTPKRSEPTYWEGDICWFSVKDAPSDGNVFVIDTVEKITDAGLKGSSTKLLPLGTTIITARGTVGKLALTGVITAMNQSCYGVIGAEGTGPYLNYLQVHEAVETLQRNTHGAVFDTITQTTFSTVFQTQASVDIRDDFEKLVTPMFEMIKNNLQQNKGLSELRDTLLPKLLSGELSVNKDVD